ncbi:MAG: ribbon-helix-helix protein, CopG family [Bacteroidetes bacterium]|nr:ribbon-helix-helix protein, CopG family [Bacteroidota bacterium]
MKIATVNIPESYIEAIDSIKGVLYPSRSEFVRCAFRNILMKKMKELFELKVEPITIEKHEETDHEKCVRLCKETNGDDVFD